MPIQIQEISDENETLECPLCMEPFEVDDINFFPCVCGYQVCRFCWHRIRTDENGLCPACRTSYPENPVEFRPLTESDLQRIRHEKRQKEVQRRQKLHDCRRHLAAIRVLQKNLVFVVGLSQRLSDAEVLKRQDYFGKYGRIIKIVVNTNTSYAGSQGPSASAYITYSKMEEALRAIQSVNNIHADGRTLKASLGTTKYCSTYLKNQLCHKQDCMYLHELADEESSFTKEDMQAGKHQELEQRLIEEVTKKEAEIAAQAESASSAPPEATKNEKPPKVYSGPTWQNVNHGVKAENSWHTASGQNGEPTLSSRIAASNETRSKESKNSPKSKSKKQSPRHIVNSKPSTPTVDTLASDSSVLSSGRSSVTTTPPPQSTPAPNHDNSRLSENLVPEVSKPETVPTDNTEPEPDTESLSPTKTEENPQHKLKSNQRLLSISNDPSVLFPPPLRESTQTNLPTPTTQPLPDAIPIQSANDWEAAFGFAKTPEPLPLAVPYKETNPDNGDDDFGFDPWVECSKGLADLMEKESASTIKVRDNRKGVFDRPAPPSYSFPMNCNPPRQDQPLLNHFGMKQTSSFPTGYSHNPAPHPSFAPQGHGLHKMPSFDPALNNKNNYPQSPKKGLNEWQNGLRPLPNVNINFSMDNTTSTSSSLNNSTQNHMHQNNSAPVIRRPSPPSHLFTHGPLSVFSKGFDDPSASMQNHSSFFPSNYDRNQTYFQNGLGLGSNMNDRYSTIAPPPGLGNFLTDPAIISIGSKTPVKQTPTAEEAPHWMRSLQALVETDAPSMNPPQNASVPAQTHTNPPLSSWSNLPSTGTNPLGSITQPPPGFQSRLSYTNTMDFPLRQGLLES